MLKLLFDHRNPTSLASWFRKRRSRLLLDFLKSINHRPIRLLDVGGEPSFWTRQDFSQGDVQITIVNKVAFTFPSENIKCVVGDARDLTGFSDGEFDVAFSNSVIEHLYTFADQAKMASEMRRVGTTYFVQTPSFWFPMEPHFLWPGFQWLPRHLRVWIVYRFRPGWYGAGVATKDDARIVVDEMRLLGARELKTLFPDATRICREWVLFLVKSYVVMKTASPKPPIAINNR